MATGDGLVGRDQLLAQLRRAAEAAAAGRGGLVLLTGEAGTGKTAVAAAAAADAEGRGARVAWGWGWQGEGAPAYWPWVQVLRSLVAADEGLRRLAAGLASPARLLPELAGPVPLPEAGEPDAAARVRLLDELASVLLAAARERPLVVVLDDLQWADPSSLQLLAFLARRLPASRALVLAAWRELDQPPGEQAGALLADLAAAATVAPLGPLGDDQVALLVGGLLGGPADAALVADVQRRTGGNPFFVQQVTRLLAAGAPAGIPFGVREAIRRRLARLRPACLELLGAAAVTGPEFGPALLARATGGEAGAVRELLEEAVAANVLAAPPGPLRPYRFANDLFRETILDGLAPEDRTRLHLRVATALEAERDAGGGSPRPSWPATSPRPAATARRRPSATPPWPPPRRPGAWPTRRRPATGRGPSRSSTGRPWPTPAAAPGCCWSWPRPAAAPATCPAAGRPACERPGWPGERAATPTGWPGPPSASRPSGSAAGPRWSTSWSRCWRRRPPPSATGTRPCGPGCWPPWPGSWPGTAWTSTGRPTWPPRPAPPPGGPATRPCSPPACWPSTTPAGGRRTRPSGWPRPARWPSWPAAPATWSCWPRPGCCGRPTCWSWPTPATRPSWPSSCGSPPTWASRGCATPPAPAWPPRRCWPGGPPRPSAWSPTRPPSAARSASRTPPTSSSSSCGSSAASRAAAPSWPIRPGRCSPTTPRRAATSRPRSCWRAATARPPRPPPGHSSTPPSRPGSRPTATGWGR